MGWALAQEELAWKQCLLFAELYWACQHSQEQHILHVCQKAAEGAPRSQVWLGQW